jgi:hypothetical protein
MAHGKRGAPKKPDNEKCAPTQYSIPKNTDAQFRNDAILCGEDHNRLLAEFEKIYHERCQELDVQKLILQGKKVRLHTLELEIIEDEKRIKELEKIDIASKKRGYNENYITDLQTAIDRLLAYPKEQDYINERARMIAQKHDYLSKYVIQDIRQAIKQANGYKTYDTKTTKISGEIV